MTQLPAFLPGMVPLLPLPPLPEQATPTDAPNPFLALLTPLVGAPAPVAKPEPTPEQPVDTDAEPEDGDQPDTGAPVLPLVPPLAAALVVTPPVALPSAAPGPKVAAKAPATQVRPQVEAPVAEGPAPVPTPAPPPVVPQAQPVTTTALPVVAPSAVVPPPQVDAPTPAPAPAPIAHQVFPEVVRIAVTGETPKRVVVRLQPEHLGEVRVVVRTGKAGLEVSLAAGTEARAAIREGAPELRRMLEAAGSPDARVVVRHLPEGPTSAPAPVLATTPIPVRTDATTSVPGPSVDVGAGTTGGTAHGDRRDRPQQDAPPRAGDGRPDRALEPAVRRTSGLDVMM